MNSYIQIPTRKDANVYAVSTGAPTYLKADFAVRAIDDRMTDYGIHKNDLVYARKLERGECSENGDIVVVSLFSEVSLWIYYQKDEIITLNPAGMGQLSIVFEDEEDGQPEIVGKAIAVLHELA